MSAPIEDEFITLRHAISLFTMGDDKNSETEFSAEICHAIYKKTFPVKYIRITKKYVKVATGDFLEYGDEETEIFPDDTSEIRNEILKAWKRETYREKSFDMVIIDRLILQNWALANNKELPPALSPLDTEEGKLLWQKIAVKEARKYYKRLVEEDLQLKAKGEKRPKLPGIKGISEYLAIHQVMLGISKVGEERTADTIRTEALVRANITGRKPKGK